jgi:hypothetical protein
MGTLAAVGENEEKGLNFTVKVNYKYPELNADAQRQIAQHQQTLLRQQGELARAQSVQQRQNILNQIATTQQQLQQSMAQLYKTKDVNLDVKCRAAENMRVRKFEPVQAIDPETGEFIKMTKPMIDKARGPEGYPGYKADSKILANGQPVSVYIWKDSKTPANFLDKSKQATIKVDDLQSELKNFRYDIIMIHVLADAPKQ